MTANTHDGTTSRTGGTGRPLRLGSTEAGTAVRHTVVDSPLGALTLVASGEALTGIYFEDHLRGPSPGALGPRDPGGFDEARRQLEEYFTGERRQFDLPLAPRGEPFRQRVWQLLRHIPYGETRSYGQLARELGDPALAQAVGAANGRNPLSVVVPCHRVVGADGSLTGYAGGLERKRALLELEGAESVTRTPRLF
ncbi:methylated-DNA--[protein]-cysteine S-methyltransferase [Streptomyces marispadix]|uniref:Methylated-DNA--protein-cysteine methyltransferase n=1 Tax=Streptomyces marispadix TaxID=2922868 RepID=A0ABS9T5A4_9ACTN|nr:methylated-DNA--[protein]-cysteine S-methyltransferase [Streptomyces marispadix]MCH6163712.1 methylated-DNA--[protein]-cysteine S-methyltransferase [Streptomyces marispadix]